MLSWLEFQLKENPWLFLALKLTICQSKSRIICSNRWWFNHQFLNKKNPRITLDESKVKSAIGHMYVTLNFRHGNYWWKLENMARDGTDASMGYRVQHNTFTILLCAKLVLFTNSIDSSITNFYCHLLVFAWVSKVAFIQRSCQRGLWNFRKSCENKWQRMASRLTIKGQLIPDRSSIFFHCLKPKFNM